MIRPAAHADQSPFALKAAIQQAIRNAETRDRQRCRAILDAHDNGDREAIVRLLNELMEARSCE